jgi:hypothetical protein
MYGIPFEFTCIMLIIRISLVIKDLGVARFQQSGTEPTNYNAHNKGERRVS